MYLDLQESRGETVSYKKGKGFRGDLSKCFCPEAQYHLSLDPVELVELLQD